MIQLIDFKESVVPGTGNHNPVKKSSFKIM